VGEVEFVGQEGQKSLRMELREPNPVWRGGIGPHKQRQEVLEDFDRQIANAFLFSCCVRDTERLPMLM